MMMSRAAMVLVGLLAVGCVAEPADGLESDTTEDAVNADCTKGSDPVTTATAKSVAACLVRAGTRTDAAGTLASLFDSQTLNFNFGTDFTAGGRPASRLDFVLGLTNDGRSGFTQFAPDTFGTDTGFAAGLQDGYLYANKWAPGGGTNQVGHFLTGVAMAYNPDSVASFVTLMMGRDVGEDPRLSALRMMVGHEMLGDASNNSDGCSVCSSLTNAKAQYQRATATEVAYFVAAAKADREGRLADRDAELRKILVAAGYSAAAELQCTQATCSSTSSCRCTWAMGNSMNDLRLTVKAVRFGQKMAASRRRQPDAWRHRGMTDGVIGFTGLEEVPFSEAGTIAANLRAPAEWLRANLK